MTTRKLPDDFTDDLVDGRPIKSLCPGSLVVQYEGKEGEMCLRRTVDFEGTVITFDGTKGAEYRVLKVITAKTSGHRRIYHYKGEKNAEFVERCEHSNGQVTHYEGLRGFERKFMAVHKAGTVVHYEGERDKERRVKQVDADKIIFYGGLKNEEFMKNIVCLKTGKVQHYKGAKKKERLSTVTEADGKIHWYNTDNAAQQCMRTLYPDGSMVHWSVSHDPIYAVQQRHDAVKAAINAASEKITELAESGECNEEVLIKVSSWLKDIFVDTGRLARTCKRVVQVDMGVIDAPPNATANPVASSSQRVLATHALATTEDDEDDDEDEDDEDDE